jgi:hypothetical protein
MLFREVNPYCLPTCGGTTDDQFANSCSAWRRHDGVIAQPRPMFGRLPWLAFERRILAFFFLVFFDIVPPC